MFGLPFSEVENKNSGDNFVKVYSSIEVLNNDFRRYKGKLEPVSISYSYPNSSLASEKIAVLYRVN